MLQAGWSPLSAALALQLTPREGQALGLSVDALTPQGTVPPAVPVPRPVLLPVAGAWVVDGGDGAVAVLQRFDDPAVIVFSQLLSADECNALMDAARPRLSASLTVDITTGGEELHPDRTSQGMFFARGENPVVARLEARIAALLGWPVENGEGLQVLRYPPGAEYRPHYDYFDPAQPGTPPILTRGGQRVATLIVYLQEPEGGGATVFPDIGFSVAPVRGNAVFFSYGQAHPASRSLHGGEPVTQGEKWIATKWLREREFR
jgi:prolyl 4-hydroxylase